jgi:hypothetical protein
MKTFRLFMIEAKKNDDQYHVVFIGKTKNSKTLSEQYRDTPDHIQSYLDSIRRPHEESDTEKLRQDLMSHYNYDRDYDLRNPSELVKEGKKIHPHVNAIRHYTHEGDEDINSFLRNPEVAKSWHPDTLNLAKRSIDNLQSALTSYRTPRGIFVHSGIKVDPRRLETSNGIIKMKNPSFTSTSIEPKIAGGFSKQVEDPDTGEISKHYLHIHVPEGSHGSYIERLSRYKHEREFLLHPESRFHVDAHPHSWSHSASNMTHFHWNASLVHDGVNKVG